MKYLALQLPGLDGQTINVVPPTGIHAGGPGALSNIITLALDLAVLIAVIVCLFSLLLSGFNWITSEGDKQKVASARQRLAFSIIGLIVVLMSFAIINAIYSFFLIGGRNFLGSQ
jgi:uncharacterized metal-binding protein